MNPVVTCVPDPGHELANGGVERALSSISAPDRGRHGDDFAQWCDAVRHGRGGDGHERDHRHEHGLDRRRSVRNRRHDPNHRDPNHRDPIRRHDPDGHDGRNTGPQGCDGGDRAGPGGESAEIRRRGEG
ncbi:hypothetical protein GCM10009530_59840 [Microbispora corallina]|uniref:Transposase n=1 Tax=Microbispora corallina TaxID=83302 RepID=A0ABQ4GA90_9ACTN|nr:hypothetical protein Mco01_69410 [Microbispora corallina]